MNRYILLILFLILNLYGQVEYGKINMVLSTEVKKEDTANKDTYFRRKNDVKVTTYISQYIQLNNNTEFHYKISNRLKNTYIDRLWVEFGTRKNNNGYKLRAGTISMVAPIFKYDNIDIYGEPLVYLPATVYFYHKQNGITDRYSGARLEYSRYINDDILKLRLASGVMKLLDQSEVSRERFKYNTPYLKLKDNKSEGLLEWNIEYYTNYWLFFMYNRSCKWGIEPGIPMPESKLKQKLKNKEITEPEYVINHNGTVAINVRRYGFSYEEKNNIVASEYINLQTTLNVMNKKMTNIMHGWYMYYARYLTDKIIPYGYYGIYNNNIGKVKNLKDLSVGLRFKKCKRVTIIADYKITDFIDVDSRETYLKTLNSNNGDFYSNNRNNKIYTLKFIFRY